MPRVGPGYNPAMLFPVRDSIPSRTPPAVNVAMIVACSVAFADQLLLGDRMAELFQVAALISARLFDGLPPWAAPLPGYGLAGNLATMLLAMFLHGGWCHIIGKMWFLLQFFQGTLSLAASPAADGVAFGLLLARWLRRTGRVRPGPPSYFVRYRH